MKTSLDEDLEKALIHIDELNEQNERLQQQIKQMSKSKEDDSFLIESLQKQLDHASDVIKKLNDKLEESEFNLADERKRNRELDQATKDRISIDAAEWCYDKINASSISGYIAGATVWAERLSEWHFKYDGIIHGFEDNRKLREQLKQERNKALDDLQQQLKEKDEHIEKCMNTIRELEKMYANTHGKLRDLQVEYSDLQKEHSDNKANLHRAYKGLENHKILKEELKSAQELNKKLMEAVNDLYMHTPNLDWDAKPKTTFDVSLREAIVNAQILIKEHRKI